MKLIVLLMLVCSTSLFALDGLKMDNLKFNKAGVRLGMYDGNLGFGLLLPMGNLYKDFSFATTFDYKSQDIVTTMVLGLRSCYILKNVKLMDKMKTYVGGLTASAFSNGFKLSILSHNTDK